mmetsp:Transcript_122740/g.291937  ORF Transcript_122740/g.291937 Transcript_122740/m.291937 type:complete len:213 (+) Transcript_122740:210-848(+)
MCPARVVVVIANWAKPVCRLGLGRSSPRGIGVHDLLERHATVHDIWRHGLRHGRHHRRHHHRGHHLAAHWPHHAHLLRHIAAVAVSAHGIVQVVAHATSPISASASALAIGLPGPRAARLGHLAPVTVDLAGVVVVAAAGAHPVPRPNVGLRLHRRLRLGSLHRLVLGKAAPVAHQLICEVVIAARRAQPVSLLHIRRHGVGGRPSHQLPAR